MLLVTLVDCMVILTWLEKSAKGQSALTKRQDALTMARVCSNH